MPFEVQEHWNKNTRDELLVVDLGNSSSLKSMNIWSDYNKRITLPFVYKSTSPKYHKRVKDWEVEDNYDPKISKWANVNYLRTFMYDNA